MKHIKLFEQFNASEAVEVEHKGKKYFIDAKSLEDKEVKKFFAYDDNKLQKISKVNGKTLMFSREDLQDNLKK